MNTPAVDHMRIVIVGATGMVGGYALRYALSLSAVERVTSISRRTTGISHPRLDEVLHQDFSDCSELARVFRHSSPDASFSFLSGSGADTTGRSRMAFARYKGEAEKALLGSGFPRLYIFRPAYIYPVKPRKEPNFSYRLLRSVYPVFQLLFPNQVIRADDLAK